MATNAKATLFDEVHSHGKNAILGLRPIGSETFSQTQNSLSVTVEAHTDAIDLLSTNYKNLEQQVKAMARVMASQNVQKLTETMKLSQEDLRQSLIHQITEKQKDLMSRVEREFTELGDAKGGLVKRIDQVESHIMHAVSTKFEEAYQMRRENRDELEKLKAAMGEVPAIADKNSRLLKTLETGYAELKNDFRASERAMEVANIEQDKITAALASEIRAALEAAKDKIADETKAMAKAIQKREEILDDEVRNLTQRIEKEGSVRKDSLTNMEAFVREEVFKTKTEVERKMNVLEQAVDHKVKPFEASVRELKHLIDEESVNRDTADKELGRRINKESQDRHHDEERMVGLISTCQAAVSKMHK